MLSHADNVFLTYTGRDALEAIAGGLGGASPEERSRLAGPVLPVVIAALTAGKLSAEIRRSLVSIVRSAGLDHPGAADAIVATLRDPDRWLFQSAAYALEAMKQGGTLTVSVRQENERVVMRIEDTGPGIASELLPNVFDPFFTTKEAGTGLGLSIVRKIVDQHGGDVEIESERGQGARVLVSIPIGR